MRANLRAGGTRARRVLAVVLVGVVALTTSVTGLRPADAAASYEIFISSDKTEVVSGKRVTFTIRVSPAAPGATVILQERRAGTWAKVRKTTLSGAGTATVAVKPEGRGTHTYRAVRPASPGVPRGATPGTKVKVVDWLRFDRLAASPDTVQRRSIAIGGTRYDQSLLLPQCSPAEWTWNLGGRYSSFRSVVGVVDAGAAGIVKTVQIRVDGVLRWQQNPKKGSPVLAEVPVRGGQSLRVTVSGGCGVDGRTNIGFGRPRVLG
jgi:hypothetical protein